MRARLLLLVLLVLLPAGALLVWTAAEQRRAAVADARADAVRMARFAAQEQERSVESLHQLLRALAHTPDVRRRDAEACSAFLGGLLQDNPGYANLGVATPGGEVVCSAMAFAGPTNIAERRYHREAVARRGFGIGEYQIGRITGRPGINFGHAVLGPHGEVEAVVFASLDLAWLGRLLGEASLPSGSSMVVLDVNGLVLARYPEGGGAVVGTLAPTPLLTQLQRGVSPEAGRGETSAIDDGRHVYGLAAIRIADTPAAWVAVGAPKAVAFAAADRLLLRNLMSLAVVGILTLGVAWIAAEAVLLRRARGLTAAARRLSGGDLGARTGLSGRDELGQLARAFDEMAASLERAEQRRALEEELARQNWRLEQENLSIQEAARLQREFVSMVSHELRTPLTAIQGFTDLLLEHGPGTLTAEQQESVTVVRDNAERLLALVNDLLDVSRLEAGRVELDRRHVDLERAISTAVDTVRPLVEGKAQRLEVGMPPDLPRVWADHDRLVQILLNLLSNAHKYTPEGGKIRIEGRVQDGHVWVDVRDSGPGLAAEEQARLFTRFYRAGRTRGSADGTGLGLVITRLLVEAHGGRITVDSAPSRGSVFSFSLPIASSAAPG